MELELPVECHFCKNKYFNNVQHSNWNTKLPAWIHHSQGIRNASGIIPTHNLLMYHAAVLKRADALMSF